ncbi:MAG: Lrp/AsnC family transcriptional regulator [Chloroflexota bacterium]
MDSSLDALDNQIIDELRWDGRQANTEIARRLGVSDTTVRNRIRRLLKKGVIRISTAVNLSRLGYVMDVALGVHCDPGQVQEVMRGLVAMPEVRIISYVTGRYDFLVTVSFRSTDELVAFLAQRIGKIPGVEKVETMHVLQVVRRDNDFRETRSYWELVDKHGGDITASAVDAVPQPLSPQDEHAADQHLSWGVIEPL